MKQLEFEKRIHEEIKGLPENMLSEILDFALFLRHKISHKPDQRKSYETGINQELDKLDNTELIHLEEEFRDYKKLYPHER